jgi:hypothetical protein
MRVWDLREPLPRRLVRHADGGGDAPFLHALVVADPRGQQVGVADDDEVADGDDVIDVRGGPAREHVQSGG